MKNDLAWVGVELGTISFTTSWECASNHCCLDAGRARHVCQSTPCSQTADRTCLYNSDCSSKNCEQGTCVSSTGQLGHYCTENRECYDTSDWLVRTTAR